MIRKQVVLEHYQIRISHPAHGHIISTSQESQKKALFVIIRAVESLSGDNLTWQKTWGSRDNLTRQKSKGSCSAIPSIRSWSGRRDSNPRQPAWKFLKAIVEAARGLKPRFQNLNLVPYLLLGLDELRTHHLSSSTSGIITNRGFFCNFCDAGVMSVTEELIRGSYTENLEKNQKHLRCVFCLIK
jgi:hypothetical protein